MSTDAWTEEHRTGDTLPKSVSQIRGDPRFSIRH